MEGTVQERAQAVSGLGHGCRDTWIRDEKGQNSRGLCICSIRANCVGNEAYCLRAMDARLESG